MESWSMVILTGMIVILTFVHAGMVWYSSVPIFFGPEINCPRDNFTQENNNTVTLNISVGNYGKIPTLLYYNFSGGNIECYVKYNGNPKLYFFRNATSASKPFTPIKQEIEESGIQYYLNIIDLNSNEAYFEVDFWFKLPIIGLDQHVGFLPRHCVYEKKNDIFSLKPGKEGEYYKYADQKTLKTLTNICSVAGFIIIIIIFVILNKKG